MARLARAAMTGLMAGLLVASAALVVSALSRLGVSCEGRPEVECAFEAELAREGARSEALLALGCLVLAAGLFLRLRRPGPTSEPRRP